MRCSALWPAPLVAATGTLTVYVAVDSTDDFFWSGLVAVFIAFGILIGAVLIGLLSKGVVRTAGALIASAAATVIVAWWAVQPNCRYIRDEIRFFVWSSTHEEQLAANDRNEGVLKRWEITGFGGMTNDIYLVADPDNALAVASLTWWDRLSPAQIDAANRWASANGFPCEVDRVESMGNGLYFIDTSDGACENGTPPLGT